MSALLAELARREKNNPDAAHVKARSSLEKFIELTTPGYRFGWFNVEVCRILDGFFEDVERGRAPRLMLFAPPRSGKSEIVSRKFPAYALGRNPDLQILATSYSADLADTNNMDVQRLIDEDIYRQVFPDTTLARSVAGNAQSRGRWRRKKNVFDVVGHRGVYRSAGVDGGITGMGGNILIIDDPVKDAREAASPTSRDATWNWYRSTFYTRKAPGAGILLIMTRWHVDDLAGRILAAQDTGGDAWQVILFPAIAEEDEEFRTKGEALHPERFDLDALNAIRRVVGSHTWQSLYQQRPVPREGGMFNRRWFGPAVDAAPAGAQRVRGWDLAATAMGGDYTAGVLMSRTPDGMFYIEHVERLRGSALEVERSIFNTASQDKRSTAIRLPQDPGQAGKMQVEQLIRRLSGFIVKAERETGSKELRAAPFAAQCEAGNVKIVAGAWNDAFLEELENFPLGAHDDQVDAAAGAFNHLTMKPAFPRISKSLLEKTAHPG